jgi:hypothetical protein
MSVNLAVIELLLNTLYRCPSVFAHRTETDRRKLLIAASPTHHGKIPNRSVSFATPVRRSVCFGFERTPSIAGWSQRGLVNF